ncbi:MAG: NUDIX domain-containing protein [Myxococcota bacterium]
MKGPYPPLGVAVDIVLLTVVERRLEVLLTRRDEEPFRGRWSLPGGFVREDESAETAASRELLAKTGVQDVFLEQLYTFSRPNRDPRSRVVSVAYYALAASERAAAAAGSRASAWLSLGTREDGSLWVGSPDEPAPLAFDHEEILFTALTRIRGKLDYAPIGFQLLPREFTLTELQHVYEAVLGEPMDKRNFRAKVQRSGQVKPLETYRTGSHRPARLYTFEGAVF